MSHSMEFGLNTISQIGVSIADVDASIEFYRDVLGMNFLFNTGTMAFFDCDGVRLMLGVPERPEFKSTSIIYYKIAPIQDAFETLRSRGVEFVGEPHVVHRTDAYDLWMAFFIDPDQNTLVLSSEVPKP